jgi:hypothetical protein
MAQEVKPRICKECGRLLPINAFERNRPSVWRSECKECRKNNKPFPNIPNKAKREYETKHPKPKIGDEFYCKVCERTITIQTTRDVNLDHDHKTGEIRGYICNRCNTGLGNFKDNIFLLRQAIRWLKGTLLFLS